MKKSLFVIMALLMAAALCACGEEEAVAPDTDTAAGTEVVVPASDTGHLALFAGNCNLSDYEYMTHGYYPSVWLSAEDAVAYPALADALYDFDQEMAGLAQSNYDNVLDYAKADSQYGELQESYYCNYDVQVMRADDQVLSLLISCSDYRGGVHPNYYVFSRNYDTQTGELLNLPDVITDTSVLPGWLSMMLLENYPEAYYFADDLEEELAEYLEDGGVGSRFTWVMDPQGATFYFSPYEIASYADGLLMAQINQRGNPTLFAPEYAMEEGTYIVPFDPYGVALYDVNLDNMDEYFRVYSEVDPEYGYLFDNVEINTGKGDYTFPFGVVNYQSYLVHIDSSHNYIYLVCGGEGGHDLIQVYDVSDGTAVWVDTVYNTGLRSDAYNGRSLFTDPLRFTTSAKIDFLSTTTGVRLCRIGDDGLPSPYSDLYSLYTDIVLTAKVDLECDELDNGKLTGKTVTIPAGTDFFFSDTDGATFVDMSTSTGVFVRLYPDNTGWPYKVNGMGLEECFDGVMFAG